jgi:CBS domain containing-hemolysin-like protein
MEELVGEIYDETDVAPRVAEKISDDELIVQGFAELRIIETMLEVDLPGKPTDTVGLWILSHTEKIPKPDEVYLIDDLEVRILKATSRSIEQVRVRRPHQD